MATMRNVTNEHDTDVPGTSRLGVLLEHVV